MPTTEIPPEALPPGWTQRTLTGGVEELLNIDKADAVRGAISHAVGLAVRAGIWQWGDGQGGWMVAVLLEEASARGLPVPARREAPL
jgi:hypothetical protein